MSETLPLYTLCKEDLESMDKEVSPSAAGPAPSAALVLVASPTGTRRTNRPERAHGACVFGTGTFVSIKRD